MNIRLVILLVVVAGLAAWYVMAPSKSTTSGTGSVANEAGGEAQPIEDVPDMINQPLEGDDPSVKPEFDVKVEVDTASGKNRLVFYVTEKHGFFVESFRIEFWYHEAGKKIEPNASKLKLTHHENDYIKAKETWRKHIEIVPAELARVGGSIGSSENWSARMAWYNRAREKNPDKFPLKPGEKRGE